MDMSRYDVTKS